jgi:hypothetical protein
MVGEVMTIGPDGEDLRLTKKQWLYSAVSAKARKRHQRL